ncbi:MAG: hypoxanthine phosphoribosyltransferase [Gammaproteobacteria bacterium]|nr:hypoxanthine phosphoribosyltransferase [Gammaproteobacteria bacterium]
MLSNTFLQEHQIIEDSFRLGVEVFNSGFRPTFIIGLWRGGSTVGIYLQECLQTLGIETNHIALRTAYAGRKAYEADLANPDAKIRVHGTQYLIETLNHDDRLLIVDDVCGSGRNLAAVVDKLQTRLRKNCPSEIRTACLFHRPMQHPSPLQPDYVLKTVDGWLTLPYELKGLSAQDLKAHKPAFLALVKEYDLTLPDAID